MGIHSSDEELKAQSGKFFRQLGVATVILVLLVMITGCAMLEDYRALTCYHTQLFQDCKLAGER